MNAGPQRWAEALVAETFGRASGGVSSAGSVQHYYISEFVVKSGTTTQQDINHPN